MTDDEKRETKEAQTALFHKVCAFCRDQKPDLVVCDELIGASALGLVPEAGSSALQEKPRKNRSRPDRTQSQPALVDLADYVSEIKKIKHPFDRGIPAREGIEE